MVDQVLKQEQGLTFDVFRDEEEVASEVPPADEGEEAEQVTEKEIKEVFPKSVFVREVVREPRMYFYKVPKLGSYLAIRLEYESCLFEGALDAAVADYFDVRQQLKVQNEEKKEYFDRL